MGKESVDIDQASRATKIYRESITEHFRALRDAKNLTQAEIADRLGVTTATVKSVESGRTRWNDENVFKFAVALGSDPAGLLRLVADRLEGEMPAAEEVDSMLAQLVELYQRRDLPGLMRHLGELAVDWGMARK